MNESSKIADIVIPFALFVLVAWSLLQWPFSTFKHPQFKVDDCIKKKGNPERWERDDNDPFNQFNDRFKIIEIGINKYHMLWVAPKFMTDTPEYTESDIESADYGYEKTPCP